MRPTVNPSAKQVIICVSFDCKDKFSVNNSKQETYLKEISLKKQNIIFEYKAIHFIKYCK